MNNATPRKRALVTGGSGGIGSAICRQLASDGFHVIVHANRSLEAAQTLVSEISAAGGHAQALAFDVTDAVATATALETLLEDGPVQVIVNNAGIHDDAVFPGMQLRQWQQVNDVSLNGFFHDTQPLMMPMIRTRWARIINITSVAAVAGNRGQVNYSAAKGALHSATKSLALEVAKKGVTVNTISPGYIGTAMVTAIPEDVLNSKILPQIPVGRLGKPEEVAGLCAYLASDEAAFLTGANIAINGGQHMF